ncbi:hypothetical protein A2U01_0084588, partial [Trifolium medium]|nr:hypothetical protein [Trifolium medium]
MINVFNMLEAEGTAEIMRIRQYASASQGITR